MFVPHTPGGELAQLLQIADDNFTRGKGIGRVKMVERGGTTLKDILCKNNPWSSEGCGRGKECFPCSSQPGRGGKCQKEGIVYSIACEECKGRGVVAEYVGESSRTGFLRGGEHLDDLRNKREKSPLWKHCEEHHQGAEVNFSMKVGNSHRTPLTRQIQESVKIENSKAAILLNSKSEYHGSRIPRVVIEVGNKIEDENEKESAKSIWSSRSKREGIWNIDNKKKRKVMGNEAHQKRSHGQQEVPGQSVERSGKRRKFNNEEDVAIKRLPECGSAQLEERPTKSLPECGQAQLEERKENHQAQDRSQNSECNPTQPEFNLARPKYNKRQDGVELGLNTRQVTNCHTTAQLE